MFDLRCLLTSLKLVNTSFWNGTLPESELHFTVCPAAMMSSCFRCVPRIRSRPKSMRLLAGRSYFGRRILRCWQASDTAFAAFSPAIRAQSNFSTRLPACQRISWRYARFQSCLSRTSQSTAYVHRPCATWAMISCQYCDRNSHNNYELVTTVRCACIQAKLNYKVEADQNSKLSPTLETF